MDQGSFLGFGITRPFHRDNNGGITAAGGADLVRACLGQLLRTRGTFRGVPGEIPWRPTFGCALGVLKHRGNDDQHRDLALIYIQDAVDRWEPRIRLTGIDLVPRTLAGRTALLVQVRYHMIDSNTARSATAFSREESVEIPLA